MEMARAQMPLQLQRLAMIASVLKLRLGTTYDRTKTLLFLYVFVRYALKSYRHVRARGTFNTVKEGWKWLSSVSTTSTVRILRVLIVAVGNTFGPAVLATYGRQGRASDVKG